MTRGADTYVTYSIASPFPAAVLGGLESTWMPNTRLLRDLFAVLGYDVTPYSDEEIWRALRPAISSDRERFTVDDVRTAFHTLLRRHTHGVG